MKDYLLYPLKAERIREPTTETNPRDNMKSNKQKFQVNYRPTINEKAQK